MHFGQILGPPFSSNSSSIPTILSPPFSELCVLNLLGLFRVAYTDGELLEYGSLSGAVCLETAGSSGPESRQWPIGHQLGVGLCDFKSNL